jgi:hypothetical protein
MLTCDMDMYAYAVLRLRYLTPACLRDGRAASCCTGGEVVLRGDGSGMLVLMFSVVQCVFASFGDVRWMWMLDVQVRVRSTLHDSGGGLRWYDGDLG